MAGKLTPLTIIRQLNNKQPYTVLRVVRTSQYITICECVQRQTLPLRDMCTLALSFVIPQHFHFVNLRQFIAVFSCQCATFVSTTMQFN